MTEIIAYILPIIALTLSGLVWTSGGYVKEWRQKHNDPEWKGFDGGKLRNDLILGSILGVGAVIAAVANDSLAVVDTMQTFLMAIWVGFPLVAAVDKFIVGGLFNK